ncbi:tRNA (adenosine(37)-N6)-threonylcarbamoyltransferase complex ATPase subunit type 1 TsaE [Pseudoxanthomonas mexicana]|uniref:tRNA (adenosine(37)-N6)-threonylcarbamoyltransferase complex ATPase subunit type 1 TsaE n=1 Tax=Pseudoxanthomonas mexicana TaxID=128785 RepID=UPI001FD71492|nr:tRNA (adenosine(37)-N6)-threonylcarbamoyltransferase complex ATPase subunit type 1 TsaE [Pseudoxanthomonas mexicana]UOV02186.1 tRNA (adenosine(37)-N6)-threonylcarbamoyltransferase complex ATPase subunit type 1 TsaE [Pseudoxanthomonas mexicana]
MHLFLPDTDATEALGQALARTRPPVAVVHLRGDLGAGKSTLARALLRALGVAGAIRSPTYTLVERYPVEGGEAWHLDLYRIGDAGELEFLGLDEGAAVLWLVEWPERGGAALPRADLQVDLSVEGNGRAARLVAASPQGQQWLERVATEGELTASSLQSD